MHDLTKRNFLVGTLASAGAALIGGEMAAETTEQATSLEVLVAGARQQFCPMACLVQGVSS